MRGTESSDASLKLVTAEKEPFEGETTDIGERVHPPKKEQEDERERKKGKTISTAKRVVCQQLPLSPSIQTQARERASSESLEGGSSS